MFTTASDKFTTTVPVVSYGFNSYWLRVNKLELELVPVGILPNKFAGWII